MLALGFHTPGTRRRQKGGYTVVQRGRSTHMGGGGGGNSIDQKKLIHQLLVMPLVLVVHPQRVLKNEAFCKELFRPNEMESISN